MAMIHLQSLRIVVIIEATDALIKAIKGILQVAEATETETSRGGRDGCAQGWMSQFP
jgi:hypothetical protein